MNISFYDAELYHRTGCGVRNKYFSFKDYGDDIYHAIEIFREKQKKKNKKFKLKMARNSTFNLSLDDDTGNTTAILGSSKQGKSYAMMYIYKKYYSKRNWITTLYTLNPQSFGGSKFKDNRLIIYPGFISKAIESQKYLNECSNNKYDFCNLFDDLISINHNKLINNLILTYRNSKISTVICMQYSNLLSKMSRANFNNVLLFQFNTDEAIEVVIKTFLKSKLKDIMGGRPTMANMVKFYKDHTGDYKFMHYVPATNELTFHDRLQF